MVGLATFPIRSTAPKKGDVETGRVREQLFVHNLCRIIDGLRPQVAIPFAADFVLLHHRQRWIKDLKLPRAKLAEYYRAYFHKAGEDKFDAQIMDMYPGDVIDAYELSPTSPYRERMRERRLNHLIDEQYVVEIAATH